MPEIQTANIISILNMKGGVGKTTLTCNLAVDLASRKKKVLVIDIDPQFNSTQTLMKFFNGNLSEYFELSSSNRTINSILSTSGTVHKNEPLPIITLENQNINYTVDLIPGDLHLIINVNAATTDRFRAFFNTQHLREKYDFILIDCPPTWGELTSVALSTSTHYLVPTNLDEFSTIGITILAEQLSDKVASLDKPLKCLGAVYMFLVSTKAKSGIARAQATYKAEIEEYFDQKMADLVKSSVKPFSTLFYNQRFFVTSSAIYRTEEGLKKRPQYAQKVTELTDELLNRL